MRNWRETLQAYRDKRTAAGWGFNPDGMCLKVCRTARLIGPMFLSAKQSQDATPEKYRIYKVRNLRRGMVLYFDDPNDSNKFGHIVTMIGRVKGGDRDSLHDVLVETNSVVSGATVVVRADYFNDHWGDPFKFGAWWLNGEELDFPQPKPPEPEKPEFDDAPRVVNFRKSGPHYNVNILDRAVKHGRADLAPKVKRIERLVRQLPDDKKDTRVAQFVEHFEERRFLDMPLLHEAVKHGRSGTVKDVRNRLNGVIKSIIFE